MSKLPRSKIRENCKIKKNERVQVRMLVINFLVLLLVVMVGIFYLTQTNNVAAEGYRIDELKNKISDLTATNKQLEIKSIELQSMSDINEKIFNLKMVKIDKVNRVEQVSSAVAYR